MATESRARRVPRGYETAPARAPHGVRGGEYVAALPEEEVVVFLIGMRINRLRKVQSWWPVFTGMPRMLRELAGSDRGLLHVEQFWFGRTFLVVQYWRSAEELGRYARDTSLQHAPAWAAFNRAAAGSGDVGIFHETYVVPREGIESVYGNMTAFGLARALGSAPRGETPVRVAANQRLGTTDPEYVEAR